MSGSVLKKSENLADQQAKDETTKPNKLKEDDSKNELSDEDKALKEELEFCVKILSEPDTNLYKNALECIRKHIRSSTTSMTSVPKPLKFMRPHYNTMKEICDRIVDEPTKLLCCDIISVLAMTIDETQDCLKYRLLGTPNSVGDWGHEYIRHLTSEILSEWEFAMDDTDGSLADVKKLETLIKEIVPFCMSHNAETEACDLLIEVERLEYLDSVIDENSYSRVCLYLVSCAPYVSTSDAAYLLKHAIKHYWRFKETINAVRLAIQMNDTRMVRKFFVSCTDPLEKKQIAFILANHRSYVNVDPLLADFECGEILSNSLLSIHFLNTARELDVMEPKTPEEVYKSHLEVSRSGFLGSSQVDSARQNLAASFVNGFVNAGFCRDKLLCEDGNKWLFRNKEHGMFSAAASFGLILLWDIDGGLTRIDKYLYSADEYIKGGTLMSCGILNSSVNSDCDPALALLNDYVLSTSTVMRIGAISGLGIAYAGTNNDSVLHVLLPALTDSKSTMEVIGVTSLACGMITVGHANVEFTETLIQVLMEKSALELKDTFARFIALGLALTHLGQKDSISTIKEAVSFVPEPLKSMLGVMLEACAYVGTGHVLKVQQFLHLCSEHHNETTTTTGAAAAATAPSTTTTTTTETNSMDSSNGDVNDSSTKPTSEKDEKTTSTASTSKSGSSGSGKEKDGKSKDKEKSSRDKEEKEKELFSKQAMAVIGIALISMGEDIGSEMVFRHFGHLIRYCEPAIRRAVPLALGIISVSNPKLNIIETLGKFSHDTDQEVAYNAIFAMGLVGAGTNNSRLAAMLRQLAQFYAKEPNSLFMVRIAQGLTHMGKGMLTLNPYHSDRQLLSYVSISAIIATVVAFLDVKNIILGKSHYLLYMLTPAIQPRLLITLDESLNPLPVPVRVGLAVDVVGQAGKPKTITGFQTHTTPVLLNHGERAELATDQYISVSPIMEGTVILRKNPNYDGFVDFKK